MHRTLELLFDIIMIPFRAISGCIVMMIVLGVVISGATSYVAYRATAAADMADTDDAADAERRLRESNAAALSTEGWGAGDFSESRPSRNRSFGDPMTDPDRERQDASPSDDWGAESY